MRGAAPRPFAPGRGGKGRAVVTTGADVNDDAVMARAAAAIERTLAGGLLETKFLTVALSGEVQRTQQSLNIALLAMDTLKVELAYLRRMKYGRFSEQLVLRTKKPKVRA